MYFLVLLRYLLSSDATDERLTAKIRLASKLRLIALKAMNPWRRRRCPECGGRSIIWGRSRWVCFCGCGKCVLHCQGRCMKDAIRDWNARVNLYKKNEPLKTNKCEGVQP